MSDSHTMRQEPLSKDLICRKPVRSRTLFLTSREKRVFSHSSIGDFQDGVDGFGFKETVRGRVISFLEDRWLL